MDYLTLKTVGNGPLVKAGHTTFGMTFVDETGKEFMTLMVAKDNYAKGIQKALQRLVRVEAPKGAPVITSTSNDLNDNTENELVEINRHAPHDQG
ncbi:MAG TPA: hypothetical protein DCG53_11885 [Syntrophus sp. (in: bacteria)]|jgi:hypothetical protein|nr:hypothetical protein [Syntrophus sp. (in: bacteria)]